MFDNKGAKWDMLLLFGTYEHTGPNSGPHTEFKEVATLMT